MSTWPVAELGELIQFFDSKRVPFSSILRSKRQGAFPYYGASGIIDWIDDYIFEGRYLLIAEDGENLNSRKLPLAFLADGRFWVNNHAHIVRGKAGALDDVFLQQWFAQADISGYVTGAAQPKLTQANLRRIKVAVPPLTSQRKIATILSGYDRLIENHNRRIKLLEEMAQRLYREWFVEFRYPGHQGVPHIDSELGPIPQGWLVQRMHEVADVIDCLHSKKPEQRASGTGTLLQLFNIDSAGLIDLSTKFLISEADYKRWTSRIELDQGDCVITNVGRIAAVGQIPPGVKAAPGRNMTAIRPRSIQIGRAHV